MTVSLPPGGPAGVVVIGASAGGLEALQSVLADLPADLAAAVVVVLHLSPRVPSSLARILARHSPLPVATAVDSAPLVDGRVVVAVPDCHLVIRDGRLHLGQGPRENGHRPAVDPLFRSAARWYGERVAAVVLSGALDDGAAGALTVASQRGTVLVQAPDEAMYRGMPAATVAAVAGAVAVPLAQLGRRLAEVVARFPAADPGPGGVDPAEDLAVETDMAELDPEALAHPDRPGRPSGLACPDCHGVLFEIDETSLVRYRCRVGHAWSPESLVVEQEEELESALWMALRVLEERAELHRRMAATAREAGRAHTAAEQAARASDAAHHAEVIRGLLLSGEGGVAVRT